MIGSPWLPGYRPRSGQEMGINDFPGNRPARDEKAQMTGDDL
jgi:hypothetical protein